MPARWVALMIVLGASSPAGAQHLDLAGRAAAVVPPATAPDTPETDRLRTSNAKPSNLTLDGPRDDTGVRALGRIVDRLPIARIQNALRRNTALRVIETAAGATILGSQIGRSSVSPVGQLGVQAIKFGGAAWLERPRFRVEPQARPGGFAVYVRKLR